MTKPRASLYIPPADLLGWAEQRGFPDLLVIGRDASGRIEIGSTGGTLPEIEELLAGAKAHLEERVSLIGNYKPPQNTRESV